jgi:hypothetical protein
LQRIYLSIAWILAVLIDEYGALHAPLELVLIYIAGKLDE